jgi:predicted nucleotidyltransferase
MGIDELLKDRREDILRIAAQHGAHNVRVFGSVARGEARSDSDVDLLVELESGRSLLDLGGLLMDLQTLLGREVDVVTDQGLRDRIRARVLQEAKPL